MNKFVFSDPHFYSENIIVFGQRPFKDVAEMNNAIISNYNQIVGRQDICYWLGDIMYGATKERVRNILNRMRGRKFLIMGNHDRSHAASWWQSCGFEKVYDHPIYDARNYIMLSHEPLPEFGNIYPIVNYHGHIHIQDYDFTEHKNYINVCLEKTEYKPVLLTNPYITHPREFGR